MRDEIKLYIDCMDSLRCLGNYLNPKNDDQYRDTIIKSTYTQLLITLHDLLKKLENKRGQITFTDDVTIDTNKDVNDIFDLVRIHRNAACHETSKLRNIGETGIIFSFNKVYGKANMLKVGDITYGCDYKDDVAIYYGHWRMYFNRNLKRLLENIETNLQ